MGEVCDFMVRRWSVQGEQKVNLTFFLSARFFSFNATF
jgi:hypothetical protein